MLFPAIYQNSELHAFRSAKVHQLVHCGPNSASRIEHVINEHDTFTFDVFGEFGSVYDGICSDRGKVVSIERDVDNTVKWFCIFESFDLVSKPFGERHTASSNSNKIDILGAVIILDDLRRETGQGPLDTSLVHDPGLFNEVCFVSHSTGNRSKPIRNIKIRGLSF